MPYASHEERKKYNTEYVRNRRAQARIDAENRVTRDIEGLTTSSVKPSAVPFHLSKEQQRLVNKMPVPPSPYQTLSLIQAEQRIAALEADNLVLKEQVLAQMARTGELETALGVIQRIAGEHLPMHKHLDGERPEYAIEKVT